MINITKQLKIEEVMVRKEVPTYVFECDELTAQTMMRIFGHVGGDGPHRNIISIVINKMRSVGLTYDNIPACSRSIHFNGEM